MMVIGWSLGHLNREVVAEPLLKLRNPISIPTTCITAALRTRRDKMASGYGLGGGELINL